MRNFKTLCSSHFIPVAQSFMNNKKNLGNNLNLENNLLHSSAFVYIIIQFFRLYYTDL